MYMKILKTKGPQKFFIRKCVYIWVFTIIK